MDMTDLLRLEATALALVAHDVALVPDSALRNPTPCEGWTITDLLRHMNERHDAIARTVLPPLDRDSDDPRDDFARIAARVMAVFETNETVHIPWRGPDRTARVIGIHVVDMLVHRWDLARALRTSPVVPAGLAEAVLPLARANTAPGSPLNAPGGAYHPPVAEDPAGSVMDTLVALLGRDPRWSPPEAHRAGGAGGSPR